MLNFCIAVYVWCDEVRDIRLWPSGFESFTDRFVGALTNLDDQNCIDITGQLQNSSLIFSFKLRYRRYMPKIRIAGRDANSVVCKGPVCFNDTHPVIMVHSPADVEPDDNNLFHPACTVCPYRRTTRFPEPNLMRCHFMCRCNWWVDGNGFCDSQFMVIISPTIILPTGNDTMLCGIKEMFTDMGDFQTKGCFGYTLGWFQLDKRPNSRHWWYRYIDKLVQGRCNSSALANDWRLSCTNPSI